MSHRLLATIATDIRIQFRNGFYVAAGLMVVVSVALLLWLPRESAQVLLPVVIIGNVVVDAFYFVSGLVLLERLEGTLVAQRVTPLRAQEYIGGKLATLTALSLVESLLITVAVLGVGWWLIPVSIGIALAAVLFCLVGVAVVLRYPSINEFLLPSVLYTFLLSVPVLGILGVGPDAAYVLHPLGGPLALMRMDASHTPGGLAYALIYPLLWIVPAYLWARHALETRFSA